MSQWTRNMFGSREEEDAGAAGTYFSQFESALQTWVAMQMRVPTVAEAALTFNVAPLLVIEACEDHPWLFVVGLDLARPGEATIELEGE